MKVHYNTGEIIMNFNVFKKTRMSTGIQESKHLFYNFLDKINYADKTQSVLRNGKNVTFVLTIDLEKQARDWYELIATTNFCFVEVSKFDGIFIDNIDKFYQYTTVAFVNAIKDYFQDRVFNVSITSDDTVDDQRIVKFNITRYR